MLADAALGVATFGDEGLVTEALLASNAFVCPVADGFDMLFDPRLLIASTRA